MISLLFPGRTKVSQTKHRSIRTENRNDMDELEQAMHIKAHRAKKKATNDYDFEDEDFDDESLYAEVEYLLRKNR